MKLPRDLGGTELVALLARYDYSMMRQTGSQVRLTTQRGGEHYITIPMHDPLRPGTLNAILKDVAEHLGLSREELLQSFRDK